MLIVLCLLLVVDFAVVDRSVSIVSCPLLSTYGLMLVVYCSAFKEHGFGFRVSDVGGTQRARQRLERNTPR